MFSGIGAPELAAPGIDWRWSAEIDRFACAVLAARFPETHNLGDVTKIDPAQLEPVNILVFGSPCQSFSVAGNRQGMDDPRGNLALVALGIVGRIRPRWVVFENVPGLLSSGAGRDFGASLGTLAKCGYGFAYRILDAQHFGVPQRRRRVFVVGHLGDWRAAAAVLFERKSLRRDPPPRREAGQRIAPTLESRANAGGAGWGTDFLTCGGMAVPLLEVGGRTGPSSNDDPRAGIGIGAPGDQMFSLQRGKQHGVVAFESRFARNGRGGPSAVVPPLKAQSGATGKGDQAPLIAFDTTQIKHPANRCNPQPGDPCHPLAATGHAPLVLDLAEPLSTNGYTYTHEGKMFRLRNCVGPRPRRLTPRECERLQGLPDDFTLIDYCGKPAADGPRYRAIGNSMAVPVIGWILRRIAASILAPQL